MKSARCLLVVVALVLGLAVPVAILLSRGDAPGVTPANVERLTVGMTIEEADAVLGEGYEPTFGPGYEGERYRRWDGNDMSVLAKLDNGQVTTLFTIGEKESLYSKVCGWLGLITRPAPAPPATARPASQPMPAP